LSDAIENESDDEQEDDSSIDEHELAVASKGDNTNEINNMITDMYKSNTSNKAHATKSNLKTTSIFDPTSSSENSQANPKKVSFSSQPIILNDPNGLNNKRKSVILDQLNQSATSNGPKSGKTENDKVLTQLIADQQNQQLKKMKKSDNFTDYSTSYNNKSKDPLVSSSINFDMFACDQDLKEMIFRRIYYILSPDDFIANGKIPPRGNPQINGIKLIINIFTVL
jgi:hypothetical protein